jgi:hypothetical protein
LACGFRRFIPKSTGSTGVDLRPCRKSWQKDCVAKEVAYLMGAKKEREKVQGQDIPFTGKFPVAYFLQLGPTSR